MIDPIEALAMSLKSMSAAPATTMSIEPSQAPSRSVDGFDAERFSRLMEAAPIRGDSSTAANRVCPPERTGKGDCLGDRMLSRISSMGEEFQKTWEEVASVVAGSDNTLSMQDMLKAQLHLVRVATEYETIGKAIGKSTQNVDQMLRMQ